MNQRPLSSAYQAQRQFRRAHVCGIALLEHRAQQQTYNILFKTESIGRLKIDRGYLSGYSPQNEYS